MAASSAPAAQTFGPRDSSEVAVVVQLVTSPPCLTPGQLLGDACHVLNSRSEDCWISQPGQPPWVFEFEAHQPCLLARFEWKNPSTHPHLSVKKFSLEVQVGAAWEKLSEWEAPATSGWHSHAVNLPGKSQKWRLTILEGRHPNHGAIQAVLFIAKSSVSPMIAKLWADRDFADVEVVVGQQRLPAHRAVLAAASPVFAAMLHSGMQEDQSREIRLPDAEAGSIQDVLEYMYTGKMSGLDPLGALVLGHKYEIPGLVMEVAPLALEAVTAENVTAAVRALRPYAGDPQLGQMWESLIKKVQQNADLLRAALADV